MLTIVVAHGNQRQIGLNNQMPWHNREDLLHFKTTTLHKTIVMGRKTFTSLPKPLPDRTILVATKQSLAISTIADFEAFCQQHQDSAEEIFVCGGAQLYRIALPYAKKLIISQIDYDGPADTYFPTFDEQQFHLQLIQKESFLLKIYTRKDFYESSRSHCQEKG